ncbi:hypothetical protein GIB67_024570 [Kingdonia uniflora]|uniref:Uncharacterized protein n=1 Tax=Kingdonia uniflora TaxID=39325 RepID=A0A7J7LNZ2_9MAGN|nr:hypothetical protein GIB67_024570 [Kingdonia uniflora]
MEEALEMARSKDTKERMAGVERLHQLLEASRKSMSSVEVTSLLDCSLDLLKDNNFRVSQGALQALASAAVLSGEHLKLHFNSLVPAVVERLGDGKQPVRDAARRLLLTLMEMILELGFDCLNLNSVLVYSQCDESKKRSSRPLGTPLRLCQAYSKDFRRREYFMTSNSVSWKITDLEQGEGTELGGVEIEISFIQFADDILVFSCPKRILKGINNSFSTKFWFKQQIDFTSKSTAWRRQGTDIENKDALPMDRNGEERWWNQATAIWVHLRNPFSFRTTSWLEDCVDTFALAEVFGCGRKPSV